MVNMKFHLCLVHKRQDLVFVLLHHHEHNSCFLQCDDHSETRGEDRGREEDGEKATDSEFHDKQVTKWEKKKKRKDQTQKTRTATQRRLGLRGNPIIMTVVTTATV